MRISRDAPTPQWNCFIMALECEGPELRSYYDTVTGEVHMTGIVDDEFDPREQIEADPGRYRRIDPIESREEHAWMERFAEEELPDGRLRDRLLDALVGRGCFRRFKNVLLDAPDERESWFSYRDRQVKAAIERWFDDHDLTAGAPPPWRIGQWGAEAVGSVA